jgi:hypothetical protein
LDSYDISHLIFLLLIIYFNVQQQLLWEDAMLYDFGDDQQHPLFKRKEWECKEDYSTCDNQSIPTKADYS